MVYQCCFRLNRYFYIWPSKTSKKVVFFGVWPDKERHLNENTYFIEKFLAVFGRPKVTKWPFLDTLAVHSFWKKSSVTLIQSQFQPLFLAIFIVNKPGSYWECVILQCCKRTSKNWFQLSHYLCKKICNSKSCLAQWEPLKAASTFYIWVLSGCQ